MGQFDSEYRKYTIFGVDSRNKKFPIFSVSSIERVDDFTRGFENKEDALLSLSQRYGINFSDFYVYSKGQKQTSTGKVISDIVYESNIFPSLDNLHEMYVDYLLEDRQRIKKSFAKYKPRFAKEDLDTITTGELRSSVRAKINSYMKIREVYFELLKKGKIKSTEAEYDYVKELKEQDLQSQIDRLTEMLSRIDTSYIVKEPEDLTEEEVRNISDNIMIDKIILEEEEPFLYYDLEDYERMSKGRSR